MWSHVVLPEVAHVSDDPDPHQHGAGPEEDAADVIACEYLKWSGRFVCLFLNQDWLLKISNITFYMHWFVFQSLHYLSLDLDLENGTDDAQRVADDDEDVPAVHKLKLVWPRDHFPAMVLAVVCVLLFTTQGSSGNYSDDTHSSS